jgi:uncharacterized MAPEG superfamily protein
LRFIFPISGSAVLLLSIATAAVLVYLPYLVVAYGRFHLGYDFSAPRLMFDKLPAYAQRATWAHQNGFETFMPFTAAALMAYVTHQTSAILSGAALTFVVTRFFYSVFYILNVPVGRAAMFAVGSACTAMLFAASLASAIQGIGE